MDDERKKRGHDGTCHCEDCDPDVKDAPEVLRVAIGPADVIVFEYPNTLSEAAIKNIEAKTKLIWPNNKIVVLEQGMTIKVVREGAV